ncbi:MAG: alpha/beta fold hydrolase [Steroidobacteraceae bacterium]
MTKPNEPGGRRIRAVFFGSLPVVCAVVALLIALGALYGAAPAFQRLPLFVLALVSVACATAVAFSLAAARFLNQNRRRFAARSLLATLLFGGALIGWLALEPLPEASPRSPDPRGQPLEWHLSTGSRVAVWELPPPGERRQTPVVVLGGGPGAPTTLKMFRRGNVLRDAGFETVYFDQAGTGASDLLPVEDYTFSRAVSDLDAVRAKLNAPKIVLLGFSYGSMLAGAYAARYPSHVAAMLLLSPGPFPGLRVPADPSRSSAPPATHFGLKVDLYVMLVGRNPLLAEQWIAQDESRRIFNALSAHVDRSGGGCRGAPPAKEDDDPPPSGFNAFASLLIQQDFFHQVYRGPASIPVPALVLRGRCDPISPLMAKRYAAMFPAATYVEIPGTGHTLAGKTAHIDRIVAAFVRSRLGSVP